MGAKLLFEMSFEDGGGWHSLFVRGHITPKEFLAGLLDPERDVSDPFDEQIDEIEFSVSQVEQAWWFTRPATEDDCCDELEWIFEPCPEGTPGGYPVTYIAL